MVARIIDGRKVAASIRQECRVRVESLRRRSGIVPGLAVVLVGDNPASALYVANKVRACAEVGIQSHRQVLPASIDTDKLVATIATLGRDPAIHGILVQLPLPAHIDMRRVLSAIPARLAAAFRLVVRESSTTRSASRSLSPKAMHAVSFGSSACVAKLTM